VGRAAGAALGADPVVLLVTEGGYPFYRGGVSVWCDRLIRDLPSVKFALVSFVGSPRIDAVYPLPGNVISCAKVPLWGIREVLEANDTLTIEGLRRRRRETSDELLRREFLPSFRALIAELYQERASLDRLADAIHGLYRFFMRHDFDTALRSRPAWQCFVEAARDQFAAAAARIGYDTGECSVADVTAGMTMLYRWLIPLANALPRADLVHATSVGLPSLAAIAAKLENGSPVLLTEHGVYLRERCLQEFHTPSSLFVKFLTIRFALHVTELSYSVADQISPGSDYNRRWELRGGAKPERIATIYNGVDPESFRPTEPQNETPLVVWVGRITPVKDLITLIRAAGAVHDAHPDVRFALFGAAPEGDEEYYKECVDLVGELGLRTVIEFRGYVPSAEDAFNEGDVVVMSKPCSAKGPSSQQRSAGSPRRSKAAGSRSSHGTRVLSPRASSDSSTIPCCGGAWARRHGSGRPRSSTSANAAPRTRRATAASLPIPSPLPPLRMKLPRRHVCFRTDRMSGPLPHADSRDDRGGAACRGRSRRIAHGGPSEPSG